MLRKALIGVGCALFISSSMLSISHAAAISGNTVQVEITVMADGVIVSGQEVWLNYSDGQSVMGTTLKVITDPQGKAVFQVPAIIFPQDTAFLSAPSLNADVRGRPFLIRDDNGDGIVPLIISPMTWALLQ